MNERGVEALVVAAIKGVTQVFGSYGGMNNSACAVGVLHAALGHHVFEREPHEVAEAFGLTWCDSANNPTKPCEGTRCPECGISYCGYHTIVHLNDNHRADFITIARKLG